MIAAPTAAEIARGAALLRAGEVVAFPTETVYGLGADAGSETAVRRIFEIKGRPANNPIIVHISEADQISAITPLDRTTPEWPLYIRLSGLWPGPLSIVVPALPTLSPTVRGGLPTVAVRVPAHPVAQALLREFGGPIAAPSANRSNYVSPTTARHVEEEFGTALPLILDGGACAHGLESTIISVVGGTPRVLRYGAITVEQIAARLEIPLDALALPPSAASAPEAPGMLREHYAPQTPVILKGELPSDRYPGRVGAIRLSETKELDDRFDYTAVTHLSREGDLSEVGRRLYAALRELDRLHLDLIVVDPCEETGLGRAIMDRLRRATARSRK